MPKTWTGKWQGGRTYEWVIEKMRHGRRYTTPLEVGTEKEALAELALFERDPEAYLTRAQAKERRAAEAVYIGAENVGRFLEHLKALNRTERYRKNVRTYLAALAEPLADRDLRSVSLQELKRMLAEWSTARKARIIAIKSFRRTGSGRDRSSRQCVEFMTMTTSNKGRRAAGTPCWRSSARGSRRCDIGAG